MPSLLFEACRARVEKQLAARLRIPARAQRGRGGAEPEGAVRLRNAMRYAALSPGKRMRAALVYMSGAVSGARPDALDAPACAVELIHSYSLIHDDLPAMDDDDFRRGEPSCHRAFDEGTAILAGDALQTLAFDVLAEGSGKSPPSSARRLEMIRVLADACGPRGMAGGQAIDLAVTGQRKLSLPKLEEMHARKTGALIRACVRLGALAAPRRRPELMARLDHYAHHLGIAFQIRDDVLDRYGNEADIGRPTGSDAAQDKPTYLSIGGVDEANERARAMCGEALDALEGLGARADPLRALATFSIERDS